jgi:hypothetical protein
MKQYHQNLIEIFRRYLTENDITIKSQTGAYFELSHTTRPEKIITAQFLWPLPVDEKIHGTKNNTPIDSIVRFEIMKYFIMPDLFIFPIHNPHNGKPKYAIVPNKILEVRSIIGDHGDTVDTSFEIVFWLMLDDLLFNCTNISAEGEWFFLSKQAKGWMADDTDMDYTHFLNNWKVW